ncbi:Uma2 family endonuclease [Nocardia rhamnosiphila]|uniref:Uma2 family endonuclease n=1 Tax=Nocardia rhamnosiphila TaxID=426716 RepID=UPI0004C3E4A8|nr:Uma2 family endonuclease [Nocardia rhamnosiphila]
MSSPRIEKPDLPEYMTWSELERLPGELADQIELWNGRVVWVRPGPREHQKFTRRLVNEIERCAREYMSTRPEHCWEVESETNVFLGATGKSDFLAPDFLVHRCIPPYQDVHAADTVLVGEVLSPSNTQSDIEAKKSRYAAAGILWYWEVTLRPDISAIATILAYGLETRVAELPEGVRPLHRSDYRLVGEWTHSAPVGVSFGYPFPIDIGWSALAF